MEAFTFYLCFLHLLLTVANYQNSGSHPNKINKTDPEIANQQFVPAFANSGLRP